jgi:GTP-binding protein
MTFFLINILLAFLWASFQQFRPMDVVIGFMFIKPAVDVYEGMVVGKNALDLDIEVNVCRTKKLTNMRSSGADEALTLTPPKEITLDFALEYIGPDELVEVTPESIRIRKKFLLANDRKREKR